MSVSVLDLTATDDIRDIVHRAVEELVTGGLVAVPTETVYGLAALATDASAVARLLSVKQRSANSPLALAVKSLSDVRDYVPQMEPLADRLARRCWPGPVTLVVDPGPFDASLIGHLPELVRHAVAPNGCVGFRVVTHPSVASVLQYVAGPLVLTSANRSGQPDTTTAQEVVATFGDSIDLVLDGGRCRYGQPSSVVRTRGKTYELLREGVVSEATIQRLSKFMVLLVCTGNTCRSPMAEVLMQKHLAERLGCHHVALEQQGILVASAGIAASQGGQASPHAIEVMREMGLILDWHRTQRVTETLARHADLILTMTHGHRNAIVTRWPDTAGRTELLREDHMDITDPIGGSMELYRKCAEQMDCALKKRASRMEV
ncbi:MAG: threonylcarbamoyl-AMP synthase [Pirellulales bacterium]|nr:threonylcarbamoyl-AMP synthase [Pirellulales bacterium]